MLFSEPKIPQSHLPAPKSAPPIPFQCSSASRKFLNRPRPMAMPALSPSFSALQRAENSSIAHCGRRAPARRLVSVLFSEPKIPQSLTVAFETAVQVVLCFSALQRAENSSISLRTSVATRRSSIPFQCSSASRKFLNLTATRRGRYCAARVSVLFSEPKIPQFSVPPEQQKPESGVSVLFSEPKIPQSR